jgi:hypothetical protein
VCVELFPPAPPCPLARKVKRSQVGGRDSWFAGGLRLSELYPFLADLQQGPDALPLAVVLEGILRRAPASSHSTP